MTRWTIEYAMTWVALVMAGAYVGWHLYHRRHRRALASALRLAAWVIDIDEMEKDATYDEVLRALASKMAER